jgi:predicted flap endonuclease-1-like 5' DNA nuclease
MYEHFNPLALTDAWWQHLLMLLVSAILGYIIGYRSRRSEIEGLEAELAGLDSDLDLCLKNKKTKVVSPEVAAHVAAVNTFVAPPVVAAAAVAPPVVETPPAPPVEVIAPVVAAPLVAAVTGKPDDLKVVEGIGPKIEQLLHNAGILTFAQLADTDPVRIKEILDAAGPRYQMHVPTTWPAQSALARDGKWDELKVLTEQLYKGRNDIES